MTKKKSFVYTKESKSHIGFQIKIFFKKAFTNRFSLVTCKLSHHFSLSHTHPHTHTDTHTAMLNIFWPVRPSLRQQAPQECFCRNPLMAASPRLSGPNSISPLPPLQQGQRKVWAYVRNNLIISRYLEPNVIDNLCLLLVTIPLIVCHNHGWISQFFSHSCQQTNTRIND